MTFGFGVILGAAGMALLFLYAIQPELLRQCAELKHEIKVYRNLLVPALARLDPVVNKATETAISDGAAAEPQPTANQQSGPRKAAPSKVAAFKEPQTVDDIWKLNIPYREKFKLMMKLTNTKQMKRDHLASALEKQKPQNQEKINAAV